MELSKLRVSQLRNLFENHVDISKPKSEILQDIFKHYTFQQILEILKTQNTRLLMREQDFWYWISQFGGHYTQSDIVHEVLDTMDSTVREDFLSTLHEKINLLQKRFEQQDLFNIYSIQSSLQDILYYFVFQGQSLYYKLLRTFVLSSDDELTTTQRQEEFRKLIQIYSPETGIPNTYEYPSIESVQKLFL